MFDPLFCCNEQNIHPSRYHQMAGRSGRAGVLRGEEGGKAAAAVDIASGESFLIIPVRLWFAICKIGKGITLHIAEWKGTRCPI